MEVQSDIALSDLIEEVEAEFECSRGIELRKKVSEDNWVLLEDPVDLKAKSELKAAKVTTIKKGELVSKQVVLSHRLYWVKVEPGTH